MHGIRVLRFNCPFQEIRKKHAREFRDLLVRFGKTRPETSKIGFALGLYDYMIYFCCTDYITLAHTSTPHPNATENVPRHCNCINSCNSSRHLSNDSDEEDADICSGKHSTVLPLAGLEKCKAGWKTSKVSRITRYYKSRKYGINVSNKA